MIYKNNNLNLDAELTEMTYDLLIELKDMGKAEIIDTAYDGTCLLFNAENYSQNYVVLCDNSVITQTEDNTLGEPIFPYS